VIDDERFATVPDDLPLYGQTVRRTYEAILGNRWAHVRRPQRSRTSKWIERGLILSGAVALVWCAYIMASAAIVQHAGRKWLEARPSTAHTSSSVRVRDRPPQGSPIAGLSIPSVGLSAIVLQGSDDRTLHLGPGHIETTALPGEAGNVAIAGHRDTFFRPLRNVKIGDDIWLETPEERVQYRIAWFRIVHPDEVEVIAPSRDRMLTLVTCYPFQFIGQAPDRFIVRAVPAGEFEK